MVEGGRELARGKAGEQRPSSTACSPGPVKSCGPHSHPVMWPNPLHLPHFAGGETTERSRDLPGSPICQWQRLLTPSCLYHDFGKGNRWGKLHSLLDSCSRGLAPGPASPWSPDPPPWSSLTAAGLLGSGVQNLPPIVPRGQIFPDHPALIPDMKIPM